MSPKAPILPVRPFLPVALFSLSPSTSTNTNTNKLPDSNVDAAYWTAAECNVAIICASLPFLRPLISRLFPRLLSSHSRTGYGRTPATKNISPMTPSPTLPTFAAAAQRPRSGPFDDREEYDTYSISAKHGERDTPGSSLNGIEITTEMTLIRAASGRIEQVATSKSHLVDA